jgi:Uma2 family endonuclease
VQYAWLVDTKTRTLEAYRLDAGDWLPIGIHRDDDEVRTAPFEAVTIRVGDLWA